MDIDVKCDGRQQGPIRLTASLRSQDSDIYIARDTIGAYVKAESVLVTIVMMRRRR